MYRKPVKGRHVQLVGIGGRLCTGTDGGGFST